MSYSFDKNASDGDTVTLANGITYQYNASKDRWDTQDSDTMPEDGYTGSVGFTGSQGAQGIAGPRLHWKPRRTG